MFILSMTINQREFMDAKTSYLFKKKHPLKTVGKTTCIDIDSKRPTDHCWPSSDRAEGPIVFAKQWSTRSSFSGGLPLNAEKNTTSL